jgi:hypothetical protein
MKNRIKYTDGPIGEIKIIPDFLPSPDKIVLKDVKTRVTINLNKSCVNYFKRLAKTHNTKYQKVIRDVLDYYALKAS